VTKGGSRCKGGKMMLPCFFRPGFRTFLDVRSQPCREGSKKNSLTEMWRLGTNKPD
jgi:hypothetical protein